VASLGIQVYSNGNQKHFQKENLSVRKMQMLLQELGSLSPDVPDMVHLMPMCQWSILDTILLRRFRSSNP
jgi:hypothetical protein